MVQTDEIRALADVALRAVDLTVWDVEIGGDVVRVFVERDGGVDLDALSAASSALSDLLDAHDELVPAATYHLEVSSPGLERALRTPEHFGRYIGTTVTVKTAAAVAGARRHRGVLVAVDGRGVTLRSDADPTGDPLLLGYDQIERAHTVLDWGPTPKSGRAARPEASPPSGTADTDSDPAADASATAAGARDTKDPIR